MNSKIKPKTKKESGIKKVETKDVLNRWFCHVMRKNDSNLIISHLDVFEKLTEIFDWYRTRKRYGAMCVRGDKRVERLFTISDLFYIQADGSYCIFHFVDGKEEIITQNMSAVEKKYVKQTFTDLVRIHRSYIINLAYFPLLGPNFIQSSDGHINLPVGKDFRKNIYKKVLYIGKRKDKEPNENE